MEIVDEQEVILWEGVGLKFELSCEELGEKVVEEGKELGLDDNVVVLLVVFQQYQE